MNVGSYCRKGEHPAAGGSVVLTPFSDTNTPALVVRLEQLRGRGSGLLRGVQLRFAVLCRKSRARSSPPGTAAPPAPLPALLERPVPGSQRLLRHCHDNGSSRPCQAADPSWNFPCLCSGCVSARFSVRGGEQQVVRRG